MTHIIYLGVLTMAALASVVSLKRRIFFPIQIIALIVLYTCFVEWSVLYKGKFMAEKTNAQIYNCYMLGQYLAFAYYFQQIIQSSRVRKGIQAFLYLYPVFWYFLVFFVFQFNEWNSYVFIIGGVCTILWAIVYCYELLAADEPVMLRYNGTFWIAIGLVFFYVCNVPYMGMYRFLTEYHTNLATLLWIPLQISNIVMYSLFTYAFVCQLTVTKKS